MVQENWSYLCGVPKDIEADIIIGLLSQENIPVIKQYPDAGAALKISYGLTTGVDLYVPFSSRATALQLIKESLSVPFDYESEFEEKNLKEAETVHDASDSALLKTSHSHLLVIFFAVLILLSIFLYRSNILW